VLDLLIANGHLHEQINLSNREVNYREPILLLKNDRRGNSRRLRLDRHPGRGLAAGDLITMVCRRCCDESERSPVLLRNSAVSRHSWVGVNLRVREAIEMQSERVLRFEHPTEP